MDLNIAEIFHESGELQYRYSRYLSNDGSKWVRHGLFTAFHRNGELASEGTYVDGLEDGNWRDFHENGLIAAEGSYVKGVETGTWRYWNADGTEA
jgi:antitoxin component YwqK of YwqJK toxin-antitoxin module